MGRLRVRQQYVTSIFCFINAYLTRPVYNWTQEADYLDTARKTATLFLDRIPADGVIPWYASSHNESAPCRSPLPRDFDAPDTDRPADSSAATIVATGLLLLSQIETDSGNAQKWRSSAIEVGSSAHYVLSIIHLGSKILNNVTTLAWNDPWESLLSNGTVNEPAGSSLTGTAYGSSFLPPSFHLGLY